MAAVQQQERTTIIGAIVNPGNATVTVTKAGMAGSPLAIPVAVLALDNAATVAGKMAAAMNAVAAFSAVCLAYNIGAALYVLVLTAAANDATMNVAYANDTCTGLAADATSDHYAIGDAGTVVNGYTTLAALKLFKRITSTNANDDTVIEGLIEAASRYADKATGRRFYTTSQDETRTYQAANGERVYTDDIISVTTLKTDGDGDRVYETTWATTDYDLLPDNAALDGKPYTYIEIAPIGRYSFPTQRRGVQITGKFGYSAVVPDDIELAVQEIVVNLNGNRFGTNNEGATTITGAGVVITPRDVPQMAADIFEKYKRGLLV